jgi:hypothetical protein
MRGAHAPRPTQRPGAWHADATVALVVSDAAAAISLSLRRHGGQNIPVASNARRNTKYGKSTLRK